MSDHQHTVLALLILIIALRLAGSGRLGAAWASLWSAGSGTSTGQAGAGIGTQSGAAPPASTGAGVRGATAF